MCKILNISRSTYYCYEEYETKKDEINDIVVKIFNENQHVYGTRKLKVELAKINYNVSRWRIAIIMRSNGLVSAYTIKKIQVKQDGAMTTTLTVTESYSDILTRWFREAGIVNVTPLTVEKAARRIEALMPTRKEGADSIRGLSASAFKDFFTRAFYAAFIGNNHCFSVNAKTGAITLAPVGEPAEDLTKAE